MSLSAPLVFGLTGAAFVLLHVLAWKLAEKLGRRPRLFAAFGSLLLCLPAAWFVLYYLHFLPEPPLLYQLRSLPCSEGLLALLGVAAGFWRSVLPRILKAFPTAAGVFLLTIPFLKPVFRPLDLTKLHEQWKGDACIQSSWVTCGPASAASILRHLGDKQVTELDLAREAWTSASGTEAWHLARVLRRRGYQVNFLAPNGLPDPKDLPGILGTGMDGAGHFIAVLEITADEIVYVDPLQGLNREKIARFLKWRTVEPFFMSIRH